MFKKLLCLLVLLLPAVAVGQTKIVAVSSLPATCNPGSSTTPADEVALVSGGNTSLYVCSSSNTWSAVGGSSAFNAITSGANTAANMQVSSNANLSPLNVGQVAGSQVWLSPSILSAPALSTSTSGGNIASGHGIGVVVTYNTAAGETLPSFANSITTGAGSTNSVTVTAPALPSGYTGYTVYDYDSNAGGTTWLRQTASAACVNITGNCVIGTVGVGAGVPTVSTAWVQPPNLQAQSPGVPLPQGWFPSVFATKLDGNSYPILGLDTSTCSPLTSPCGVPMWVDRFFINDTGVNLANACGTTACFGNIKNNPFSIAHTVGNGTLATSGNDDRAAAWRVTTPTTMTGSNNPRVMGWYGEMYLNGSPTALTGGGPDSGFIGMRNTLVDQRSSGNMGGPIVAFDAFVQGLQTGGASYGSCNPCTIGVRSNVQPTNGGSLNHAAFWGEVGGSGVDGNVFFAQYGGASVGNTVLYATGSFPAASNNYFLESDNVMASIIGGPLYLPSLITDASTLPITASISTKALTTNQLTGLTGNPACTAGATSYQMGIVAHDSNGASVSGTINFNNCAANLTSGNTLTLTGVNAPGATSYDFYLTSAGGTCNGGACTLGKIASLSCTPAFSAEVRQPLCTATYTGTAGDGTTMPSGNTTGGIGSAGDISFTTGKGQHLNSQAAQGDSWGVATCSSSTVTVTFTRAYASTPVIVVSDETAAGGARVSAKSASSFTITCSGASDVVDYFTGGNPN